MSQIGLSKSRILKGIQCPKWLYLEHYEPNLAEEGANEQQLARGHQVGKVARSLFPGGSLIEYSKNGTEMLEKTQAHLRGHPEVPLFEGTFTHAGVLVRADILISQNGKLRLIEVKSAASMKEYYKTDCSIQAWVIESCGYHLDRIELAYIDSSFVYKGSGNYQGLFKFQDITDEVRTRLPEVPTWIEDIRTELSGSCPTIDIGEHCSKPWSCPFYAHCSKDLPEYKYPVSILPNKGGKALAKQIIEEGYHDLREVPAHRITNPLFERIRRVTKSGETEIDHDQVRVLVDTMPYPRFYLDFETVQFAVPVWVETRPYQILPFQWSCHIENELGHLEHKEFLDTSGQSPMKRWAESLLEMLGNYGPIFHYHHFEKDRLNEAAERFPDLVTPINSVIDRLVDVLPITRKHYYHPAMKGSFSIKYVLPTVTQKVDYGSIGEVQEGGAASEAYLEMIDDKTTPDRRSILEKDLRVYCGLDTIALKYVLNKLCGSTEQWSVRDD